MLKGGGWAAATLNWQHVKTPTFIITQNPTLLQHLLYQSKNPNVFIGPESDHWQCLSVTD